MDSVLRVQASPARSGALWAWTRSRTGRNLFRICRWVHVYLSTAFFGLLFFFGITGFTLNHLSWFPGEGPNTLVSEPLPEEWRDLDAREASIPLLEQQIQQKTGLKNPRKVDVDLEMNLLMFDYPLPAGYAFVTIDTSAGTMEVERQEGTLVGVLNDLHKGRHTGGGWSLVIDIAAIATLLLSCSGMVLLFQQARWRLPGMALAVTGFVIPWLIYLVWVPR